MKDIKITFVAATLPLYAISYKNGRKTFELQGFDGILTASVQYDYDRRPLELSCEIKEGDQLEITLLKYRIEIYVNGVLKDEEWPAGERLFACGDEFISNTEIECTEYIKTPEIQPNVLASFENAEGWYPGNGVFVGDCMPYRKGDEYHVLYLKDRHHHRSKWGLGAHQWEHISTKDFKTWQIHPMAVPITDPKEGSICTGSWICHGNTEYLYYTVRRGRGIPAPICRSVSNDGYHFEKDKNFFFTISDRYTAASARDPKVIRGEDGLYHMFLTTRLAKENRGCLVHLVSSDLNQWSDTGVPIYISDDNAEPECSDYFAYKGRYYLIYSLHLKAHYLISDSPFDGWRVPENPIIPCASVPKGAIWDDKIVFAGFERMGGYGGKLTFKSATVDEDGALIFD